MYNMIIRPSYSGFGRVKPNIFYSDRKDKKWKEIYIDDSGIFRERPAVPAIITNLDTTLTRGVYHTSHFFWGKSDRIAILLHLPLSSDKNNYVLSLEMNRDGIINFTKMHINQFILFGTLMMLISIGLGKLFARRIVRPIKRLSEIAHERAEGTLACEFHMEHGDEIGVLADSLNIMTGKIDAHVKEIERRMKTMETMNKIDKAVLSSISRTDLLDRVMSLVSSLYNVNSITMSLYNDEKKGFDLLSRYHGALKGVIAEKPFIPADNFDSNALMRLQQVFQFKTRLEEKQFHDLFDNLAGIDIGAGLNVPVYLSD
jgi:HAMP domain-containing protein